MKNQPLYSRIGETLALLLAWPISVVISIVYLLVACTLQIGISIMKVWE